MSGRSYAPLSIIAVICLGVAHPGMDLALRAGQVIPSCQRFNGYVPFLAGRTDHFQRQGPNPVQNFRGVIPPNQGGKLGLRFAHRLNRETENVHRVAVRRREVLVLVVLDENRQNLEPVSISSSQRGINFEITRGSLGWPSRNLVRYEEVSRPSSYPPNSDLAFSLLRDLDVRQLPRSKAAAVRCLRLFVVVPRVTQ